MEGCGINYSHGAIIVRLGRKGQGEKTLVERKGAHWTVGWSIELDLNSSSICCVYGAPRMVNGTINEVRGREGNSKANSLSQGL